MTLSPTHLNTEAISTIYHFIQAGFAQVANSEFADYSWHTEHIIILLKQDGNESFMTTHYNYNTSDLERKLNKKTEHDNISLEKILNA